MTGQQPERRQLQPWLISQEVIANNAVKSHLWCQKFQLNHADILTLIPWPDLLTGAWQCPSVQLGESFRCRTETNECLLSGTDVETVKSLQGGPDFLNLTTS